MSVISEVKIDLLNVISYLEKYENALKEAEPLFDLKGQLLEKLCRTHPQYLVRYDQLLSEIKSLEGIVELRLEEKEGILWKKYNEGYQRQLSGRDIQAYISGEVEVVKIKEILLEVQSYKSQYNAIVEAFKTMGWRLNNIVKLRISELQDTIL